MSSLKWAHSSVLVMTLEGKIKGDDGDEKKRGGHLRDPEKAEIRGGFVLTRLRKMDASDTEFDNMCVCVYIYIVLKLSTFLKNRDITGGANPFKHIKSTFREKNFIKFEKVKKLFFFF